MTLRMVAIAACDPRGVIGKAGKLPWHIPEDLAHFRSRTLNNVMIMGHKTFASMPSTTFENRTSFVFTKAHKIDRQNVTTVGSLSELTAHYVQCKQLLEKTSFVIGGREIFELFFNHNLIHSALITHVHKEYEGDTYFPLHYLKDWNKEVSCKTLGFSIVRHTQDQTLYHRNSV